MNFRNLRIASTSIGVVLIVLLIYESSPATVVSDLKLVGSGILCIVAIEMVVDLFNSLGWWFTLPRSRRGGQFFRLFLVRLAGTALSQTVPTATMGGEPTKVFLLRRHFPLQTAIASVVISKFAFTASKAIFIAAGMAATASLFSLSHGITIALLTGFIATLVGVVFFLILQLRGLSAASLRMLARLRVGERWKSRIAEISPEVDSEIIHFYRSRPGDFAMAVLSHQLAFLCGVAQVFLLLGWMGLARNLRLSLAIESFSMLIGFVTFVVPDGLGIREGGMVLIFSALGLPVAAGLTTAITFRLTSIFGAAVGLMVMSFLLATTPRGAPAPSESET